MTVHLIPLGFHTKHIYQPIKKYGGEKIIIFVSPAKRKSIDEEINNAIQSSKKIAQLLGIYIKVIYFKNDFDIEERLNKFNTIFEKEEDIVVNLTGGTKFDSLLLYYTALQHPDKIKEIIYSREDIEEPLEFPKIVIGVETTPFEREIINILKHKPMTTKDLAKKLNKQVSQIIRYVSKMEEKHLVKIKKQNNKKLIYINQ